MTLTETEIKDWHGLLPKWTAYKRTAAWTFTAQEQQVIARLAWEKLNKNPNGCPTCWVDAMRELERIAGTQ
jgi:hypothetical protein